MSSSTVPSPAEPLARARQAPGVRRTFRVLLQRSIRALHAGAFDRGLPPRIALCLHALERRHYPRFDEAVTFFRDAGYAFVGPDEFVAGARERCVFLSFDDNYRSWYEALPLLDRSGVRATFYTNTGVFRDRSTPAEREAYFDRLGYCGPRVPLSTTELAALDEAGHVVGAHTHLHLPLAFLSPERAREEIRRSKDELEGLVGKAVRHFSYPFGMRRFFNESLRTYCHELGFATIANAISGRQHAPPAADDLNRTVWDLERPLAHNLRSLRIDGRLFERVTGRSAVG